MHDLCKIPFGLREADNQYVDVADVPNGNECGCICPSCKTPLQARQGQIRQWYFAHNSRGTSELTQKECEYSFWVSVLAMAKELIRTGGALIVPAFTRFIEHDEVFITEEKSIDFLNPEIEKNGFDASCSFGKYSIGVIFTSPERKTREFNALRKEAGVLEISLSSAEKEFFSSSRIGCYKAILEGIIFSSVKNKRWLYHPRIEHYKNRYGEKLSEKPPFDIGLIVSGISKAKPGVYACKKCKIKWRGYSQCPDCHGHGDSLKNQ
jgi:hypothetical protein